MRHRLIVALAAGLLLLSACGGGDGEIVMDGRSAGGTAESTAPADDAGGDTPSTADTGSDDGSETTEPADTGSGSGSTDSGSSDAVETDLDKCIEVSQAFSDIAGQAATMTPADAQDALDRMKTVLPEDLRDDMQTMVDGFSDPSGGGMSGQAFIDANEAITEYLSQVCGAGG